eukprot:TRINITY_DN1319_c0_g1_i1.p1 TRINITY_DN1319_c0_g1~~TRINITY_DN1319_c0_g1_i1.p1  ORF type:complete len:455 (+),score=91.19 TRINITY_DN1319_c0_g1_i1:182-1546(+)
MQFSKQPEQQFRHRGGPTSVDEVGDLATALAVVQRHLNKGMYKYAVDIWTKKAVPFMQELRQSDQGDTWSTPRAAELAQTYHQLELRLDAQAPPYSHRQEDRPPEGLHVPAVGQGLRFAHNPHEQRNPVVVGEGSGAGEDDSGHISHRQRFAARPQEHPNPVIPSGNDDDAPLHFGKHVGNKPSSAGVVGGMGHGLDEDHPLGGGSARRPLPPTGGAASPRPHGTPQPRREPPFAQHAPSPLNPYARIPAANSHGHDGAQGNGHSASRQSQHSQHSQHAQSPLAAPSLPSSRRSSHASSLGAGSAAGLPAGSLAVNHASLVRSLILNDSQPIVVAELSLTDGIGDVAVNCLLRISSLRGDVVESGDLMLTVRNNGSGFRLIDRQALGSYMQPTGGASGNEVATAPLYDIQGISPTTCHIRYHPARLFGSASTVCVKLEVIATGGKAPTPGIMLS